MNSFIIIGILAILSAAFILSFVCIIVVLDIISYLDRKKEIKENAGSESEIEI